MLRNLNNATSNWKIPLYKIYTDDEDIRSISRVIRRGMDWAIGPEIEEFEKSLANYVSADYCVAFNSGTSAGHAALLAIGTKPGDEIIVPSFTFIATANWALMVNAKPKFVDIEEETYGLNPELIESTISKKTKIILPIHYAGLPCKIEEISKIAHRKKICLIEDAAESLGASVNKKMVGTFGDLSIFSFAGNKVLTTGEGGAVIINSRKLFEKLKLIRSHGRLEKQSYFSSISKANYVAHGYNWRMSSITAALALSQLSKLKKLINMRRKNANYLSSMLSKFEQIKLHRELSGYRHVYQLYSIQLPNSTIRNKLMQFLAKRGIMSKVFFYPVHLTSFYKMMGHANKSNLKVTETVSQRILSLPLYPGLKLEEMRYIAESISEFFESV